MKNKLIFSITILIIISTLLYYGQNKQSSLSSEEVGTVLDFFPNTKMIKVFNGGYENAGGIDVIDKIKDNKVLIKSMSTGVGVVLVYEITPSEITLIYSSETNDWNKDEDYFRHPNNRNDVILKGPIKMGTTWAYDDISYEITEVNKVIKTPSGEFETIEVTSNSNGSTYKRYYAKNIGLVKTDTFGFGSELIKLDYEMDNLSELMDTYLFGQ